MTIVDPYGLGSEYPTKWQLTAFFLNSGSLAINKGDLCCLVWSETAQSVTVKPADTDDDSLALCAVIATEDIAINRGGDCVILGYAEVNIGSGSVSAGERVIATSTAGIADGGTSANIAGCGVFIGDELGSSNRAPAFINTTPRLDDTFGAISASSISASGAILSSSPTGGIGYSTGAGGDITQITSAATGVEINAVTGQITTVALTTAAGAEERFTVTNTAVGATDVVCVSTTYAGAGTPLVVATKIAAEAFDIVITNLHTADALDAVMVINFVVIQAVAA